MLDDTQNGKTSNFNLERGVHTLVKNVTSKQKKEAIEALFSSSEETVQGDGYKFLFWTHDKGLYSGFSRVDKESKGKTVSKYYGFILDLVNRTFSMEGVSGKHLVNNSSNLKEVFAYGKPFEGDSLNSSMEVFKVAGNFLGCMEQGESANFGRGVLRLIQSFPSLEIIVKEYFPGNLLAELNGYAGTYATSHYLSPINRYFRKNNITSIRKMLHRKIIYTTWKKSTNPLAFLDSLVGGYSNQDTLSNNMEYLANYLETANNVFNSVDTERGYHDALMWYQMFSYELLKEYTGYYAARGSILYCLNFVKERKGNNGVKNLLRYSYASLYHQQAFDQTFYAFRELRDYYQLVSDLTNVPLYPRYLKTTHDVASRNLKVLKSDANNVKVAANWSKHHASLDAKIGDYLIYQALTPKEIVDEGNNNSNCVGGYVHSVAEGTSSILFLREVKDLSKSWVTLEVQHGTLVQAYATFDAHLDDKAQNLLSTWCKSRGLSYSEDLGGASTLDWGTRKVSSKVLPLEKLDKVHDKEALTGISDKLVEHKIEVESVSRTINQGVKSFS